jgi:peroxiredoxin
MNKRIFIFVTIAILSAAFGAYLSLKKQDSAKFSNPAVGFLMNANLPDAAGQNHSLSEWRGKVLLVNFWATWCPPCVEEMPELVELQNSLASKNLQIVGIGVDSPSNIQQFTKKYQISYPLLVAGMQGTDISRELGNQAGGLPFTVLIDTSGKVRQTYLGRLNINKVKSDLNNLWAGSRTNAWANSRPQMAQQFASDSL